MGISDPNEEYLWVIPVEYKFNGTWDLKKIHILNRNRSRIIKCEKVTDRQTQSNAKGHGMVYFQVSYVKLSVI